MNKHVILSDSYRKDSLIINHRVVDGKFEYKTAYDINTGIAYTLEEVSETHQYELSINQSGLTTIKKDRIALDFWYLLVGEI